MLTSAATAGDLINAALREIGVLGEGETPTGDMSSDAIDTLNRLVDQWALERLRMYVITRTTWTVTSGVGEYSIGSGQTVNTTRPAASDDIVVKYQDTSLADTTEFDLIRLTDEGWQNISIKSQTATYPSMWYYFPTATVGKLELWPLPTSATLEGVLYAPTQVAQFSGLTTSASLPPGYQRMIVKNLAVELAPGYGRQIDPMLMRQAMDATQWVKQRNMRLQDLSPDPASLIGWEWSSTYSIYEN